jgi:O-antigen/teichoic acid export membrane protein
VTSPESERPRARKFTAGLSAVGSSLLGAGLFTYLFLSLTGRLLGPEDFAPVSTLWALVLILGPGLFLPLQQELGRVIAGQRAERGGGQAVRRTVLIALVMCAVVMAGSLAGRTWATHELFAGNSALFWCYEGAIASYAVTFVARGVLSGLGDFGLLSQLIASEALARLLVALTLWVAGWHSETAFGVAIAVAPLVSTAVGTRLGRAATMRAGVRPPWRDLTKALGWLVVGSLLAQFVANAGPIAVQVYAGPGQSSRAGVFLSALVIARVTLYLFQAVQATILPNIAELASGQRLAEIAAAIRRLTVVCLVLVVVSGLGAFVAGPFAVRLLFGEGFVIGATTMGVLAAASAVYVLAAALTSVAIAIAEHALVALAWSAGAAGFVLGTQLSADLFDRVELGYSLGSAAAAVVLLVLLPMRFRAGRPVRGVDQHQPDSTGAA